MHVPGAALLSDRSQRCDKGTYMPFSIPVLLGFALCVAATSVWADDQDDCDAGIARLQAEIDKSPEQPVLAKLKEALQKAREQRDEGDFDECKDVIAATLQDL